MQARLLKTIALEVAKLEAAITAMIKATPHFAELAEIIESVPGLGKITSAGLIAAMPELGQVSDKIVAALLGVAPYDDDSGQRQGEPPHQRRAPQGPQPLLHGLVSGPRPSTTPCSRPSIDRLIAKGKEPKVALTACMRKLIVILNTMIARRQKWDVTRYAKSSDPRSVSAERHAQPEDR